MVFVMQKQIKETVLCQEIKFSEELSFQHRSLEERAIEYDDKLNLDGEYDWGTPAGREDWCEYL